MINIILLPFRGLIWLVLGTIFSLPWLIVLLPFTTNYWLPHALSYGFEHKTQASCKIESANADWLTGEIILKNVTIFNTHGFTTSDCLKFRTIKFKVDPKSFLGSYIRIKEMVFDCHQMSFVQQNGSNNFLALGKLFSGESSKNFIVDDLIFSFNGFISIKKYDAMFVRSSEFFTKKNFGFSNVCRDIQKGQALRPEGVQSIETVYNTLGTLFKNERDI